MFTIPWPPGLLKALKEYGPTSIVAAVLGLGGLAAIVAGANPRYVVPLCFGLTAIVYLAEWRRDRIRIEEKKVDFDILAQTTYLEIAKKTALKKGRQVARVAPPKEPDVGDGQ